jgi:hypothetical protein
MSTMSVILLGCLGGLLPDVIRLIKLRYEEFPPEYLKRPLFWIGVALLVAIGGLAAWALGAQTPKEALIYGFAAPELFSRLAAKTVEEAKKPAFDLRWWWAR